MKSFLIQKITQNKALLSVFAAFIIISVSSPAVVGAATNTTSSTNQSKPVFVDKTKNYCGSDPKIYTTLNLGCLKKGNPIMDLLFAVIRFLVAGAMVVITGSLVVAGIQYTTSGGSPDAAGKAKKRITSSITALFILIFGYAILNYLIPITVLK